MRALIPLLALSALTACASTSATTVALDDTAADCFVQEPASNPDGYVWRSVRCAENQAGQIRLDEREGVWAEAGDDRFKFKGGKTELREERRDYAYSAPPPSFAPAPDLRPAWGPPAYEPLPPPRAVEPKGGPFIDDPLPPAPRPIQPKGGPFINDPFPVAPRAAAPMAAPAPIAPEAYPDGLAGAAPAPYSPVYQTPMAPPAPRYGAAEIYVPAQGAYAAAPVAASPSTASLAQSSAASRAVTASSSSSRYGVYESGAAYGAGSSSYGGASQGAVAAQDRYAASGYGASAGSAYGAGSYQSQSGGSSASSYQSASSSSYGASSSGGYAASGGYGYGYSASGGASGQSGSAYAYGAGHSGALPGYGPSACVSDAGRFANGAASWEAMSCQSASARLWTSGSGVYSSGTVATQGGYYGPTRDVAGRDPNGFLTWPGKTQP